MTLRQTSVAAAGRAPIVSAACPASLITNAQDTATLSPLDREWLRRQGRAARLLEARQRTAVRDRRLPRRAESAPLAALSAPGRVGARASRTGGAAAAA